MFEVEVGTVSWSGSEGVGEGETESRDLLAVALLLFTKALNSSWAVDIVDRGVSKD